MVEFFALSVIQAVNRNFEVGTEVYLKPDLDAQNAIEFEHTQGFIYWKVSCSIESSSIFLTQIELDKNHDLNLETDSIYDTIGDVIEHIVNHVNSLRC